MPIRVDSAAIERTMKARTYNEDVDEKEENVGDLVELEPQVFGDKGERCVLCGPDLVPVVGVYRVTFLILHMRRQREIEVQRPPTFVVVAVYAAVVVAVGSGRIVVTQRRTAA